MTDPPPADLAPVLAAVAAAVRRLLAEGKRGRVEVNVHPESRQRVGTPRVFLYAGAGGTVAREATPAPGCNTGGSSQKDAARS